MKSPLGAGAGALVMVVALCFAGRSDSQQANPVKPRGRIAIMNLGYVVMNYDTARKLDAEINEDIARLERTDREMRAKIQEAVTVIQDPSASAAKKAEYEEVLRYFTQGGRERREADEAEARNAIVKKKNERLAIIYGDVRQAAQRYAAAQGIELVLCYNDPAGKGAWIEYDLTATEPLKVKTNACSPLYVAPGIDISGEILAILNDSQRTEYDASAPY
jgi:Skp family chaperone for outer membrane proteins